jgi:hypothetical protein
MYAVQLGWDRRVSLRSYLAALKLARAEPDRTFKESFCGWWPAKGREIVRQWWDQVVKRCSRGLPTTGKGNRARRRLEALLDAKAECKWCGAKTGHRNQPFCCSSCRQSYCC